MKRIMHNKIVKYVSEVVESALTDTYQETFLSISEIYSQIVRPPNKDMGNLAFPCFPLAKDLRMAPNQIALKLAENIKNEGIVKKVDANGPYINFFLNFELVGEEVVDQILNGQFFKTEIFSETPKTMIEYSQPNTHKTLHVGHMRNLCLGNSLAEILKYSGYKIVTATYPGDVGTHVAKCLWYFKKHNKDPVPKEHKGAWLGTIYSKAHSKLENEEGTENEALNKSELTEILKQLENKSGDYFDLWKETRDWSFDLMKEVYKWANVEFDRWFYESEMDSPSLELVKEYHKKGIFIEDQGAIGIDLSKDKLGFCLLVKSDGTGLYSTKDILLAKRKFEEFVIEHSIYVVDDRQSHHFNQVFKVLEIMGFKEAKDCYHLKYDVVELPDGAMSSRKGNIVPLIDLVHQMEDTIKNDYLNKYLKEGTWDQKEIDQTAAMIANGAIKYGMIRIDNTRKIVFDMKEWLKLDGETGPYLQYVHARINSLVEKLGDVSGNKIDWTKLEMASEKNLMLELSFFNTQVELAARQHKTSALCGHLYDLGKLFNSFYVECPIKNASTKELKEARLALSKSVGLVMKRGLSLLGIPAPKRM